MLTVHLPIMLAIALAPVTLPLSASNEADHAFWASFAVGDSEIDIGSFLPDGTLVATDAAHGELMTLTWDADAQMFDLTIGDQPVLDLVTSRDAHGRPTFVGGYNEDGFATLEGLVDLTSEGMFMVELTRDDRGPHDRQRSGTGHDDGVVPMPRPVVHSDLREARL